MNFTCFFIMLAGLNVSAPGFDPPDYSLPVVGPDIYFEEKDGMVVVEAEHFYKQSLTETRKWYITSEGKIPDIQPDPDPPHLEGSSNGAYIELLPDTRITHTTPLIHGVNFTDTPGEMAVVHYRVKINQPGRYYVWVRAYSTGTEDNGLHVGMNGTWPESGQRMQWCVGKNSWRWESKQRTQRQHCGVPHAIYLDIETPGIHDIQFSMREDGFEMDKFLLTMNRDFVPDNPTGPDVLIFDTGKLLISPEVEISGELRTWHKLTLTLDGPHASQYGQTVYRFNSETGELDLDVQPEAGPQGRLSYMHPNPFLDFRMTVTFSHESGNPVYQVPGYFAADGNAAETGAKSGNKWRAHLSPDKKGRWDYKISFAAGVDVAVEDITGKPYFPFDGISGSFQVEESDKTGRDFRSKGRLQYTGERYLRFAGNGEYFLKAGSDSPETLLAYEDFDGTETMMEPGRGGWIGPDNGSGLHRYEPHIKDWREGDPVWQDGKGKGLIGAINYLASQGMNAMSFITHTAGGDGENVWPWVCRNCKEHYDVSKLAQWEIVFEHAQQMGIFLHFKFQEQENDAGFPYRTRHWRPMVTVPESLDGGITGRERKLYTREIVARFGHHLALNWNLGEETRMLTEHQQSWLRYLAQIDPYHHHRVIHTSASLKGQSEVYDPLAGNNSELTGASLQVIYMNVHAQTLHWINTSKEAGKQWAVSNDEQGWAMSANPTDDFATRGRLPEDKKVTNSDMRKNALWGTFMAGGWGIEYYFGYIHLNNDLVAEDFSSREKIWTYARYALEFFKNNSIPVQNMQNHNKLIGNNDNNNSKYCFAKPGELYLVYLAEGGSADLDLYKTRGRFSVNWYNPRTGGTLQNGTVKSVNGGKKINIGLPPDSITEDWLAIIRKQ